MRAGLAAGRVVWLALIGAWCVARTAGAQSAGVVERPVVWRLTPLPVTPPHASGSPATLLLRARIADGWYLYALTEPPGGPAPTTFTGVGLAVTDAPRASEPEEHPDRNFDLITRVYEDSARFVVRVRIGAPAVPVGARTRALLVHYQTCNDRYCLPPRTDTLPVHRATAVAAGGPAPGAMADRRLSAVAPPALTTLAPAPAVVAAGADPVATSVPAFLWLALSLGLLSLLTPCVLPMLPVMFTTLRGGDASPMRRSVVALAAAVGVVTVYVGLGLAATAAFGAGGITRLAANPWLNLAFALLLAGFALNLLGAYEIVLPQRLLVASGGGHDGATRRVGAGGAFAIGAAFAITSFTCTTPLAGTLLVLAAGGRYTWPLIGLTTYALAFALPIALFALVPAASRCLPHAGPWTRTLRTALAIVELAAASKFLSNVDLVRHWGLLTRPVVLGLWTAAAIALAWVLSGLGARTRSAAPRHGWTPLRPLLGIPALALAGWLAFGIEGHGVGELEAYLPPPAGTASAEPPWIIDDFDGALARAAQRGQPLIVDFTGYTCTNCRWMEANMFPRPSVRSLLARFVRVRLFTDGEGARYAAQQRFEQDRFGTVALPFYAIFDHQGRPVATFLGMTRDAREFQRFLARGLTSTSLPTEADR